MCSKRSYSDNASVIDKYIYPTIVRRCLLHHLLNLLSPGHITGNGKHLSRLSSELLPCVASKSHANRGGAGVLPRRDSRYPSAAFTRSGVNGVWRSRTPVSCAIALPIAGATSGVAI